MKAPYIGGYRGEGSPILAMWDKSHTLFRRPPNSGRPRTAKRSSYSFFCTFPATAQLRPFACRQAVYPLKIRRFLRQPPYFDRWRAASFSGNLCPSHTLARTSTHLGSSWFSLRSIDPLPVVSNPLRSSPLDAERAATLRPKGYAWDSHVHKLSHTPTCHKWCSRASMHQENLSRASSNSHARPCADQIFAREMHSSHTPYHTK
jgi:hypothetical protein